MSVSRWRKKFIKDPDGEYRLLLESQPSSAEVATRILQLSQAVADLQIQKGKKSRRIGAEKKQGNNADVLVAEVADLSRVSREKEQEIEELLASFSESDAAGPKNNSGSVKAVKTGQNEKPAYLQESIVHSLEPDATDELWSIDESATAEEWDRYVLSNPAYTCYHLFAWQSVFVETFKHECFYLAARDSHGHIRGVLPLVHVQSRLFDSQLVSQPFLNYGGVLTNSEGASSALLNRAAQIAAELDCHHMEIRETFSRDAWPQRSHKVTMYRALPESDELLEKSLGSKLRSQCKRALQSDAEVLIGGSDQLDHFYAVFARNMRDVGTPVLGKDFFVRILDKFAERTFIVAVCIDGKPVAAAFLIGHGSALEVPWASSLNKFNRLSVNMMLYRHVLREAIAREYRYFDFGRSSVDAPTYKFKRQWGAEPTPLYWHYWLSENATIPDAPDASIKYRLLIKGWKCSPVWLTNRLGPKIIAGIP